MYMLNKKKRQKMFRQKRSFQTLKDLKIDIRGAGTDGMGNVTVRSTFVY